MICNFHAGLKCHAFYKCILSGAKKTHDFSCSVRSKFRVGTVSPRIYSAAGAEASHEAIFRNTKARASAERPDGSGPS